ncbi:DUF3274 domain-containing protein [Iodobacter sp.]|uniref:T6SS effector phospholipase Tle3 domain-containing protein n=1 Tax=Iodobacter sp. TaxID=1915058 RepID=UPI0025D6128B|nr:DUF3274 domain-containing protein [Iodobacter sp.]
MAEATDQPIYVGRSSALLMPNRFKDTPVEVQAHMPGIIVIIHGVNDVGVSYAAQDIGLCTGLNERLDRPDLFPNDFRLPKEGDQAVKDPDAIFYQRIPNDKTHSPVIHFFWGYKATDENVAKKQIHEQNVDLFKNRLDKQNTKGGGMFSNATSNISDMFRGYFEGGFTIWLANKFGADKVHIVKQAPNRHYMALAAKRLAALVQQIRKYSPDDTITLIGHSQGCLVSLTAQAFLNIKGQRAVDTLIMCNPPYGIHEPGLDYWTQSGNEQQTSGAREKTLIELSKLITQTPHTTPPLADLNNKLCAMGRAGCLWNPSEGQRPSETEARIAFPERDNRGKVYLYFSPHDMTVGLANVQGIGTLGVSHELLAKLGPQFKQRIWTWRQRPGQAPEHLGLAPHDYVIRKAGEPTYDAGWLDNFIRKSVKEEESLPINAEELKPTFKPNLHADEVVTTQSKKQTTEAYVGAVGIDPIDACDAVVKEGVNYLPDQKRDETPIEARQRYQDDKNEHVPNSYHSAIVNNSEHHRWVTAMDVALGQGLSLDNPDRRAVLLAIADWRVPLTELQKLSEFPSLEADVRAVIEANALYYKEGIFPKNDIVPLKPPAPIVDETRRQRMETTSEPRTPRGKSL